MPESFSHYLSRLIIVSLLLLAGCGSAPTLISKSAEVPVGTDLSGSWLIREDPNATRLADHGGVRDRLIPTGRSSRTHREQGRGGVSVQVFLEFGESLKITQTEFGVFISYDRAVVEEFTFGENRLVAIGPIEALRVSGWDGRTLVVETLDDSGSTLFESWHLESDDKVLVRNIRISKGDHETFSQQQIFDRQ